MKGRISMKERNNTKGITLIALVITIIILLILSGVAIATLTGENGLFARAKQVKEQTNYVQAEEKIKLAINASYDNTANLNDELLKENLNSIDGINEKIEKITYDLEITVDGYKFKIDKEGKIVTVFAPGPGEEMKTLIQNTLKQ